MTDYTSSTDGRVKILLGSAIASKVLKRDAVVAIQAGHPLWAHPWFRLRNRQHGWALIHAKREGARMVCTWARLMPRYVKGPK